MVSQDNEGVKGENNDDVSAHPSAELTIPVDSKIVNNIVVDEHSQRLKAQNPRAYSNIIRMAKRLGVSQNSVFDAVKTGHDNAGISMSTRGYISEIAVRELETIFSSAEEFNSFIAEIESNQKAKSAWGKFVQWLSELIEDLKRAWSQRKITAEEKAEANKALAEMERIKELYTKAYVATKAAVAERTKAVQAKTKTNSAESLENKANEDYNGDVSHSLKEAPEDNSTSDNVLDKSDYIGYVPITKVKMKTFPSYNESKSDANEWATRWAHRDDVETGAQTLVFYHNRCYVIGKYDSADLKYQIEGRISYSAYESIRKELVEDARNREKQSQKKMVDFLRERNERRDTDEGRGQSVDYSSVEYGREDRDILRLGRKQNGKRDLSSDISRSDEYDSEDRQTKNVNEDKNYSLKDSDLVDFGSVKFSLKNKNLTINSRIPFTVIKNYIDVAKGDKSALNKLEAKVRNLTRGTYQNDATGYRASITSNTIGKAVKPTNDKNFSPFTKEHIRNLNAIRTLPELFKKAVYVDSMPPQKGKDQNPSYKEFHHFVAPVFMDNGEYRAIITAREKVNSNTLYVLKVEVLPTKKRHTLLAAQQKNAVGSQWLSVPSDISIPDLVNGVKIKNYDTNTDTTYTSADIRYSLKENNLNKKGNSDRINKKWHTDLTKAQLAEVEKRLRKAGNPEATKITDTANWYKGRINGEDLFVIYSTEDTNNPTILYEVKGRKARFELDILMELLEVYENAENINEKSDYVSWVSGSGWLQEVNDYKDNLRHVGSGRNNQNAGILQGQPERNGSSAFRNVVKNLFGIQEQNGDLNEDKNYSLKGGMFPMERIRLIEDMQKGKKGVAERISKYAKDGVISTELYGELVEKYGAIPQGENPHRNVQVPRETEKNKKVSQTVRTILEAKATPDEAVPTIEKMVEDGVFSYEAYTDKKAIENGEEDIKKQGWTQSLTDWFDSVKKGAVSKDITTKGWILYNHAANSGDIEAAITILDAMVKHQRSAAQALQATRILKKLDRNYEVAYIDRKRSETVYLPFHSFNYLDKPCFKMFAAVSAQ